jgi:hypothetical protein
MARVYQSVTMGDADIRVALVTDVAQADLLVYRVSNRGLASGDGKWFITRDKQDATVFISFVAVGMAQAKICFVDTHGQAGWVNKKVQHPMAHRF